MFCMCSYTCTHIQSHWARGIRSRRLCLHLRYLHQNPHLGAALVGTPCKVSVMTFTTTVLYVFLEQPHRKSSGRIQPIARNNDQSRTLHNPPWRWWKNIALESLASWNTSVNVLLQLSFPLISRPCDLALAEAATFILELQYTATIAPCHTWSICSLDSFQHTQNLNTH